MIGAVFEALYITNIAIFGGLLAWIGLSGCSRRRRRGMYDVYEGDGVLLINQQTGEVVEVRRLRIEATPRVTVCVHCAEKLRNAAWTGQQDVVAEIEVLDVGATSLGRARTKVAIAGGTSPKWPHTRGLIVLVLPGPQLDLSRLELHLRVYCKNTLSADAVVGRAVLGRLDDLANGLPRDVALTPQGVLTFSVETANVNQNDPFHIADDMPVAVAEPIPATAPA